MRFAIHASEGEQECRREDAGGASDPFVMAVLAALHRPEVLTATAALLAPYFCPEVPASSVAWMDTRRAAQHLGISTNALHKLTAARCIPFHQDVPGGKCWFLRCEIDQWRRHEGRIRFHRASSSRRNGLSAGTSSGSLAV